MAVQTLTVRVADLIAFEQFLHRITEEIQRTKDPVTKRVLNDAITEFFNGNSN